MPAIHRLLRRLVPQKFKLQYFVYKKSQRRGRPTEKLALRLLCNPEKTAVDVGANIGTVSYFLSKYSKATHAFEINPAVAERLEQAKLSNTTVYRIGLSDSVQWARLRVPIADFGPVYGSGTIERANELDGDKASEYEVRVSTLDNFNIPDVGIIKIDVEGHELAVLRGARATLERDRPSLIVEILERLNGNSFSQIIEYTASLSYKCYRLSDNGFVEVTTARDETGNNDYYFLQNNIAGNIGTRLRAALKSG
jgi:FkbM family methyltransferase